jgi:hypothetical protein
VIEADAPLSISGGVPHRRYAQEPLRRNVDDVDIPIDRLEVSEIAVSDISRDELRVLRKVKAESWCHADRAMTASDRFVDCSIGWMND